jgi:hypothetical protein
MKPHFVTKVVIMVCPSGRMRETIKKFLFITSLWSQMLDLLVNKITLHFIYIAYPYLYSFSLNLTIERNTKCKIFF